MRRDEREVGVVLALFCMAVFTLIASPLLQLWGWLKEGE